MGFKEINPEQVRENIELIENELISKINNKKYIVGNLEIPNLNNLINRTDIKKYNTEIKISEVIGDIQLFHLMSDNKEALFQAASQFNLLEMVSPTITPEHGVGRYEFDYTQGPSCAIACGAGTIYRNYFVNVNGNIGQTKNKQIDCLNEIGIELNNHKHYLWDMINGYAFVNKEGLIRISDYIETLNKNQYKALKRKLRVGIQWNTQVTIDDSDNIVSQIYCSALPVAYSQIDSSYWESFAKLILEATYEATFYAGLINYEKTGSNRIYLTLVGGGAFGNKKEWIINAIKETIIKFKKTPLDIRIVSFSEPDLEIRKMINNIQ